VPGAEVLEIGAGTGQATRGLLEHGWRVVALEPGRELAAVARRVLAERGDVVVSPFERWLAHGRTFDLVFAATSWHWLDPRVAHRRDDQLGAVGVNQLRAPEAADPDAVPAPVTLPEGRAVRASDLYEEMRAGDTDHSPGDRLGPPEILRRLDGHVAILEGCEPLGGEPVSHAHASASPGVLIAAGSAGPRACSPGSSRFGPVTSADGISQQVSCTCLRRMRPR